VSAPTVDEVAATCIAVGAKENVTVPQDMAVKIARESNRNVRRALLMLESAAVNSPQMTASEAVVKTDWEQYIESLAREITAEQVSSSEEGRRCEQARRAERAALNTLFARGSAERDETTALQAHGTRDDDAALCDPPPPHVKKRVCKQA